jgi:hypothetical protein
MSPKPVGGFRLLVTVAAVVGIAMLTAGCGGKEPEEKRMSAREGRDRAVEFVINTTKQVDIPGWWPRNGVAGAQDCSLGGGKKGASYDYDQWAPRGTDYFADATKVAEYWKSLGMTVRIADSTPHPTVYASGGPVLRADFDTGAADGNYAVGATVACSAGDAAQFNREDQAERDQGTVLPGDEGVILKPNPRDRPRTAPTTTTTTPDAG